MLNLTPNRVTAKSDAACNDGSNMTNTRDESPEVGFHYRLDLDESAVEVDLPSVFDPEWVLQPRLRLEAATGVKELASVVQVWAAAAAILNDRAQMWQDDRRPVLAEECRGMANAFRTYAEGVGVPSIDTLRRRRDEARAEAERLAPFTVRTDAEWDDAFGTLDDPVYALHAEDQQWLTWCGTDGDWFAIRPVDEDEWLAGKRTAVAVDLDSLDYPWTFSRIASTPEVTA